jgi:hypothetical protein
MLSFMSNRIKHILFILVHARDPTQSLEPLPSTTRASTETQGIKKDLDAQGVDVSYADLIQLSVSPPSHKQI